MWSLLHSLLRLVEWQFPGRGERHVHLCANALQGQSPTTSRNLTDAKASELEEEVCLHVTEFHSNSSAKEKEDSM